jgi:phenylacetate-CoA ligase
MSDPFPIPQTTLIRRDTDSQRPLIPRLERTARDLLRFAQLPDHRHQQAEMDHRLGPLRTGLRHSPYWRERFLESGLSPRDLKSLADLHCFPALDRTTCAARWADLPAMEATEQATRDFVVVASSGSTGEPVRIVKDRFDQLHMWATLRFWVAWTGVTLPRRPRVALLCGLPTAMAYSARMPAFLEGALHRISLKRPRPLERLRRARVCVLFSDPDGLHWLASQEDPPRPALVLTSASYFSAEHRARIERALGAPIINYFGTTETGPLAWECLENSGRFHVLAPDVYVEENQGTLLATRLRPSVVPLLRYNTGDTGRVIEESCPCGYRGQTILNFTGRGTCLFERPDGARVDAWTLAVVLKYTRLRSFRLSQMGPEEFVLEIDEQVQDLRGDLPGLVFRLTRAIAALGWPAPAVRLVAMRLDAGAPKPAPFRACWSGALT